MKNPAVRGGHIVHVSLHQEGVPWKGVHVKTCPDILELKGSRHERGSCVPESVDQRGVRGDVVDLPLQPDGDACRRSGRASTQGRHVVATGDPNLPSDQGLSSLDLLNQARHVPATSEQLQAVGRLPGGRQERVGSVICGREAESLFGKVQRTAARGPKQGPPLSLQELLGVLRVGRVVRPSSGGGSGPACGPLEERVDQEVPVLLVEAVDGLVVHRFTTWKASVAAPNTVSRLSTGLSGTTNSRVSGLVTKATLTRVPRTMSNSTWPLSSVS